MFNKIILVGNLTRDIEIKYTPGGLQIANTGIATNRKFKSQTGQDKEEVMFIDITFFGRTAEVANQYLRKGSNILVDGRLKLDQWTDTSGQKRSKHSLVVETMKMLGGKGSDTSIQAEKEISQEDHHVQKDTDESSNGVSFEEGEIPF